MGGKASILLVLGFSMIFLVSSGNFLNLGTRGYDNLINYYDETHALNILNSASNLSVTQLWLNTSWKEGYYELPIDGGIANVYVDNPLAGAASQTTPMCMPDPINPSLRYTLHVHDTLVPRFLGLGATVGRCDTSLQKQIVTINVNAFYGNAYASAELKLKPMSFAEFAYFSVNEPSGIWWISTDTVHGPLHVNGDLNIDGGPVFNAKVSLKGKINKGTNNPYKPTFKEPPPKTGVDKPLPTDGVAKVKTLAELNGKVFKNQSQVYLEFKGDTLLYKYSSGATPTKVYLPTFAKNGVIFCENAEVRIKGVIKGQYTVAASGSTDKKGMVYFDDDVVYNTDPRTPNSKSTDLLGIVAQRNIYVADKPPATTNIKIQATLYSQEEGFGAENYNSRSKSTSGTIFLYGGIIQNRRYAVGTFSGGSISTGFAKNYRFDQRLSNYNPPGYPTTGDFAIVSWFEESKLKK